MTHVSFYQLDGAPIDRVLPKLLEKAYALRKASLVLSPVPHRIDHLNDFLWTYESDAFLPHGILTDKNASDQPILLSTVEPESNSFTYAFLLDGGLVKDVNHFERTFILFDTQQTDLLQSARTLWKTYKNNNYQLDYYTFTQDKGWVNTMSN